MGKDGLERERDALVGMMRALGIPRPAEAAADLRETLSADSRLSASQIRSSLWILREVCFLAVYSYRDALGDLGKAAVFMGHGAARSLVRDRAKTVAGALILAVGFAGAAIIYGSLQGFQRPLPVPGGDRIVRVLAFDQEQRPLGLAGTHQDVTHGLASLPELGGFVETAPVVSGPDRQVFRSSGAAVSVRGFSLLSVAPMIGRLPTDQDQDVVLISLGMWEAWGRPDLGAEIRVDGRPHALVGVMPEGFGFPLSQELWTVLAEEDSWAGGEWFGRLGPGVFPPQAEAELQGRLASLLPELGRVEVVGFVEKRSEGGEELALQAVLALVLVLLLVSCSNVSNLLLIRSLERGRVLAVHQALGAGPWRAAGQVLLEAVGIAMVGASLGLLIAWGGLWFIETTMSPYWGYHWMRVSLQPSVAVFLALLGLAIGIVSGIGPALRAFRVDVVPRLREGGRSAKTGPGGFSGFLLSGQVTLSLVALLAAVYMGQGLVRIRAVAGDFPADEVTMALVTVTEADQSEVGPDGLSGPARAFWDRLSTREGSLNVAMATGMPGFRTSHWRFADTLITTEDSPWFRTAGVTPGYFDVFNIDLEEGRLLEEGDHTSTGAIPAVVSRQFLRTWIPAGGVGSQFETRSTRGDSLYVEIVGVVEDVVVYPGSQLERTRGWMFLPLALDASTDLFAFVRGPDAEATAALVQAASEGGEHLALSGSFVGRGPMRVEELLGFIRRLYQTSGILGLFGAVSAVVVAAVGLASLLGFEMARRRREIGVRIALGAPRQRILALVVGRGFRRVLPGVAVGSLLALAGLPALGVLLGSTTGRSIGILGITVLAFFAIAGVSSLLPARRASLVDPRATLQEG